MKRDNLFFREAWRLFFFLGIVLINYPFLQIFNKTTTFAGIPLLLLYFLIGWPLSILVSYFFSRHHTHQQYDDPDKDN